MASELSCETSDDMSENELLERSLSVWRGWSALELEDFTPIALDIHTACSIGHYEWVRTIIRKNEGIDLDRKNHGGWTPLMYACYIGHDNIVSLLVNAGCCNMNARNPRGLTPLMLAASCGNESVARILIRRGANLEAGDNSGWTALFHATYAGHQKFVAFLLEKGANKDAIDPNTGLTPFMVAASEGHEIIVHLFMQNGVNTHAKAFNGDMARSLALLNGFMKIVSLIDNQELPPGRLRTEADLFGSTLQDHSLYGGGMPHSQACPLNKASGPSIRDGPEAIARMISQSRQPDEGLYTDVEVPRGYVTFMAPQEERKEPRLSNRDVTSPINQDDYRDSSGSKDFDDLNEESNAFTKTGAITIKSSSSSSGGLMAALGLSLDSNDSRFSGSALGKNDDNNDAEEHNQPADIKSKDDFVTENETQEYDVDGDSSRPVDSHSPSLNDTSSLSSSDPRQFKGNENAEETSDQPKPKSQSKLKDYFPPPDSSFPAGGTGKAAEVQPESRNLSQKSQRQRVKSGLKGDDHLPKENMSQNEIVSRFLDNLQLEECEGVTDGCDDGPGVLKISGNQTEGILTAISDGSQALLCTCNVSGHYPGSAVTDILDTSTGSVFKLPNTTGTENSGPVTGILPAATNHSGLEPTIQPAQRASHPPLNHHHPLHNRHNHNQFYNPTAAAATIGLPRMPDTHNGMYKILPPSQHHLPQNMQYLNNIPQNVLYHDLHYTPHHLQQAGYSLVSSFPTPPKEPPMNNGDNGSESQAPLLPNITSTTIANSFIVSQLSSTTSTTTTSSPACTDQTPQSADVILKNLSTPQNPLQAAAAQNLPLSIPSISTLPTASSVPSVIIPGHVTSQPISMPQQVTPVNFQQAPSSREGPQDLQDMLNQLGLLKYLDKFEEQDVDLQVFLSLTDNDLKELGIKLFGPRKKMTNAIARWHSCAPAARDSLEQAYADKLEGEMQEMAIQLNQAYEKEEHLKAQVSQEQQLRSVTESCLMEERSGLEHACQMLQATRANLRTLGEQQSRLRHYQKELRKQLESTHPPDGGNNNNINSITYSGNQNHVSDSSPVPDTTTDVRTGDSGSSKNGHDLLPSSSAVVQAAVEQMKKSDKCLKEMVKTLSSLVLSTDHVLKSMQNLGSMGKDVT